MTRHLWPALALTLFLFGCMAPAQPPVSVQERLRHEPPIAAAHRGCWYRNKAPENSLASIRDCVSYGAEMVELDVRATRDRVLVVMHDDSWSARPTAMACSKTWIMTSCGMCG
ncbi:MAG: hypothetical protein EBV03_04400 [Proteobacteria bacterium]|nr:hypothetical protein [Pseudomonadota bacterium]